MTCSNAWSVPRNGENRGFARPPAQGQPTGVSLLSPGGCSTYATRVPGFLRIFLMPEGLQLFTQWSILWGVRRGRRCQW